MRITAEMNDAQVFNSMRTAATNGYNMIYACRQFMRWLIAKINRLAANITNVAVCAKNILLGDIHLYSSIEPGSEHSSCRIMEKRDVDISLSMFLPISFVATFDLFAFSVIQILASLQDGFFVFFIIFFSLLAYSLLIFCPVFSVFYRLLCFVFIRSCFIFFKSACFTCFIFGVKKIRGLFNKANVANFGRFVHVNTPEENVSLNKSLTAAGRLFRCSFSGATLASKLMVS